MTSTEEEQCAFCLEEIKSSGIGVAYMERCRHYFHDNCMDAWYRNWKSRFCPICRTQAHRLMLWPKVFECEEAKNAVLQLQKQCFGLVNVPPENRIFLNQTRFEDKDLVGVVIGDSTYCIDASVKPTTRAQIPEDAQNSSEITELANLKIHIYLENCFHYHSADTLPFYLEQVKRGDKVYCLECCAPSRTLLLWPSTHDFHSDEQKVDTFLKQKYFFGSWINSGSKSLRIRKHSDDSGRWSVMVGREEHLLNPTRNDPLRTNCLIAITKPMFRALFKLN